MRNEFELLLEESKWIEWSDVFKKTVNEFGFDFYIIQTFGTGITAFFPICNTLVNKMNLSDAKLDQQTIVLLVICAFAIIYKESKREVAKLIEELRLRGVYSALKKIIDFIKGTENLFKMVSKSLGKVIRDLTDMFSYTALFVPFILVLNQIIATKQLDTNLLPGELLSLGVGVTTITVKNIIEGLINKLKTKFKNLDVKKILSKIMFTNDRKVKKLSEFEGTEIIQDSVVIEDQLSLPTGTIYKSVPRKTLADELAIYEFELAVTNPDDELYEELSKKISAIKLMMNK